MRRTCGMLFCMLALFIVVFAAEEGARLRVEEEIDEIAANAQVAVESDLNINDEIYRLGEGTDQEKEYTHIYRRALSLMEDRQFQPAIKLLKDYVTNFSPTAFPANRQLTRALWLDGKLTEAAYWFGRVLHIAESGHSRPHLRVAYGLWAEYLVDIAHNWSTLMRNALEDFLALRQKDMELYPIHSDVTKLLTADKETVVDMADMMFEKAIQYLDQADKYHYQQWALAMGAHGRYKKAIKVARYALDAPMNPQQPAFDEDVYKMLADFHKRQRKFEKCIKFGNSALALSAVDVIFVLSDCYLGLHKPDTAMTLLRDAAERYPFLENEVLFRAYVAQIEAFQGKNSEAIESYREALTLSTDENLQGSLYVAMAKLEDSSGDYEQAHNDYAIGAELLFDKWIYRNYKPRWEIADKPCPRKQIHHSRVTDYNLIVSRNIVHIGSDSFGVEGSTPLAAPGLAEKSSWKQRQELFFQEPSVHHVQLPHSAVFGESSLNIEQCGLLLGYPTSLDEANGLNKLVARVEKSVFLGPGGSFNDLSWLLLHKFPQLMLLKEARVFKDESVSFVAPETPLVTEMATVLGLEDRQQPFDPMVSSVLIYNVDMIEFSHEEESVDAVPFENAQFVSKWAVSKARRYLLLEGDLPVDARDKIVVIKSVPKHELEMTIARQVDLHHALEELGEVVVFNPYSPTISFEKMRAVFQTAKVIVGPHSHGLAGMLFAAPGTPVVELPVEGGAHNLYANLATALDLPYWIVPTCTTPRLGEYHLTDDNIQEVVDTVRLAIAGEGGVRVPLFQETVAGIHDEL